MDARRSGCSTREFENSSECDTVLGVFAEGPEVRLLNAEAAG
jgi:hypothetical protein